MGVRMRERETDREKKETHGKFSLSIINVTELLRSLKSMENKQASVLVFSNSALNLGSHS